MEPSSSPDSALASDPTAAVPAGSRTLRDPLAEALRIIELGDRAGIEVRLMGGLAFHALCREWTARIDRDGRDMDLATRSRDRKPLTELLVAEGYLPDRQYNALYGHKQLYFVDPEWNRPVDVLIDRLEMCHTFEFGNRLSICDPTLPPAELLLSKLQVVKVNRKDVLDALALLAEHPLAGDDVGGAAISLSRITALTSSDWGWWRTVTGNLDKLAGFLASELRADDLDFGRETRFDPGAQVAELRAAIDAAPKSARWKMRARVGDRIAWYQEPEEVG
ncbi:MAG TPA: hypothetical protein VFR93_06690, partial [Candidatus Limnocylindrales bacterium]|nr:hypothetical protein [Candidatus Limnocylindrales bacterium]